VKKLQRPCVRVVCEGGNEKEENDPKKKVMAREQRDGVISLKLD